MAVSTYSLIYTTPLAYMGATLSPNGDIHFSPCNAIVGQKVNKYGVCSTYSLVYTRSGAYIGGALDKDGSIHFAPNQATVGTKISSSGVVSTYSILAYGYSGAVTDLNGDVHFMNSWNTIGEKVTSSNTVSTYSLLITSEYAYSQGVLTPNGDIHMMPRGATVGQKIDKNGVVSTYPLATGGTDLYQGGVLSQDKSEIHLIPWNTIIGQKINTTTGKVSTYKFVYSEDYGWAGGVLAQNGDIHFSWWNGLGQKIDKYGTVSTYTNPHYNSNFGGALALNGDIYLGPLDAPFGTKITPDNYVSTSNLISYWKLNENVPSLAYDSYSDNNGVLSGATLNPIPMSGLSGRTVPSYLFSRDNTTNNSCVIVPTGDTRLNMTDGKITLSAWICPIGDGNGALSTILAKNYDGNTVPYNFGFDASSGRKLTFRYYTSGSWKTIKSNGDVTLSAWQHVAITVDKPNDKTSFYFNGVFNSSATGLTVDIPTNSSPVIIGSYWSTSMTSNYNNFRGYMDEVMLWNRVLNSDEIKYIYQSSSDLFKDKSEYITGKEAYSGEYPIDDLNTNTFSELQVLMKKSIDGGTTFSDPIVSTYPLVYTADSYHGGVLNLNGDIHFIPTSATVGQKVNYLTGLVSTYSLIYTAVNAYNGGVLAPNGDIHFINNNSTVGQKINASGVVSTYSLVFTANYNAYNGGVLNLNGFIHFVPFSSPIGQKINSSTNTVSTYTLIFNDANAYAGGVLAPNGDIHFIPREASVGQKVNSSGEVSTYNLVYTGSTSYTGGVLASNGDIHFIPISAPVGQKIDINGLVSTYSLIYTGSYFFNSGVLSPNGDIYFISANTIGQKININGVVSTYNTLGVGDGGVLAPNGDIYYVPAGDSFGQKISTLPGIPFDIGLCVSPFFNKF